MKIINEFVFNKIKEKDELLAKQFVETLGCNFIVTFNKGEEYTLNDNIITLKQDIVAYVEIMNEEGNGMSISFQSLNYGNGIGEGYIGYAFLSSQDYFKGVQGYADIRTKMPYDEMDIRILISNIENMDFEMEELGECHNLTLEGDIIDICLPLYLVELQEEFIKNVKEMDLPNIFKENSDLSDEMKKETLDKVYRATNIILQSQKKEIQDV